MRLIKINEVIEILGISRTSLYRQVGSGKLQKPIFIGVNSPLWVEHEIRGTSDPEENNEDLLTQEQLEHKLSLHRVTIRRLFSGDSAPLRYTAGQRAPVWRRCDVNDWIELCRRRSLNLPLD